MAKEGICASFHKFFHIMHQASAKCVKAGIFIFLQKKKSMKDKKPKYMYMSL